MLYMLKNSLIILFILFIGVNQSEAQTTNSLAWDYSVLPAEVMTYTQTILVDNTLIVTSPSCIQKQGSTTETTCQVVIPTLASGNHTISITAAKGGNTAETRVTGLNPNNAPRNPTNIRLNLTININIP